MRASDSLSQAVSFLRHKGGSSYLSRLADRTLQDCPVQSFISDAIIPAAGLHKGVHFVCLLSGSCRLHVDPANGLDALSVVSPCCLASCSFCNTLLVLFCYPTRVDPQKPHPNRFLELKSLR